MEENGEKTKGNAAEPVTVTARVIVLQIAQDQITLVRNDTASIFELKAVLEEALRTIVIQR